MLGKNDKITLELMNAKDIDGNIIPFQLKLPISNEYTFPEGVASLDVFEYQEGLFNGGTIVFSIYIGKIESIKNLVGTNKISNVKIVENVKITSIYSPVCTQNVLGKTVVFASLKDQDIVVGDKEELIEIIKELSNNFDIINNSIKKIRILSKKK